MGASSPRKGEVLHAPSMQQPRETLVALDAARLVVNPVLLVALPAELLLDRPGLGPHGRIFDRDLVGEALRPGAGPALDEMQVLARTEDVGLRAEVGHVDHQRVAVPVAARIAEPLADPGRQMGAAVHDDVALPALPLAHVVEDRDATGR